MGQAKLTVRFIVFIIILILWIRDTSVFSQVISDFNAKSLEVSWQLIKNNDPNGNQFPVALNFKNNSEDALPSTDWKILLNLRHHDHALSSISPSLEIRPVSGELFSTYMSNQYVSDDVMNVAPPSTYTFLEKVIDEIKNIYQESGAPLPAIHMAGDEVPHGLWERSPAVIAFVKDHGAIKTGKNLRKYYFDDGA